MFFKEEKEGRRAFSCAFRCDGIVLSPPLEINNMGRWDEEESGGAGARARKLEDLRTNVNKARFESTKKSWVETCLVLVACLVRLIPTPNTFLTYGSLVHCGEVDRHLCRSAHGPKISNSANVILGHQMMKSPVKFITDVSTSFRG